MPAVTVATVPSPTPGLPPAVTATMPSVFRWFAPAAHYVLAVAFLVGAALHTSFGLSPWMALILTGAAAILLVVGTLIWGAHEKVSLTSMAQFLRSQVPGLLSDVAALKATPGLSPDVVAKLDQALTSYTNLERLISTLAARPPAPAPAPTVPVPPPVIPAG